MWKQAKNGQDMGMGMGKRITNAFDRAREAGAVVGHGQVQPLRASSAAAVNRARGRSLSVQRALEWAFGAEHARLDFDTTGVRAFDRVGVSPEWILQQTALIGCRVDGGGASGCHPDAELIAAAVEGLADRQMAVVVASCARAGVAPDWRGCEARRIVPRGWELDKAGQWQAQTAPGPEYEYRDKSRHRVTGRSVLCPISYSGGAAAGAAARRAYLAWYGALIDVACALRRPGYLDAITVTDEMPPLSPWEKRI